MPQPKMYDMQPVIIYQNETTPYYDYWAAVTDVPCPHCSKGTVRWAEAGYVPGYRICDKCNKHFLAKGTQEAPTLKLLEK